MGKNKADYQKEAKGLGLEFTSKTTVKELKAMIDDADNDAGDPVAERRERQAARRAEAAEAAKNRAENAAAYKASVRTGPQQALDRAKGES